MSRSGSKSDLIDLVFSSIRSSGLPAGDAPLVAGVSGGVDSMVLLWILAVPLKLRVIAVHINYGKRGEDSEADEELVRRFCDEHQIPCHVFREPDSGEGLSDRSGNFQEHARDLRRELLQSVMMEHGAQGIFLAHHLDDQTETVLQKILRGSALERSTGMRAADPPWFRPLLTVPKQDLVSFAAAHDIPWRTDATNLESAYARNILRNDVFPILDSAFPGWRRNITDMAIAGRQQRRMLDYLTAQLLSPEPEEGTSGIKGKQPSQDEGPHPPALKRDAWLALPAELQLPVARHWIAEQTGYAGWSRGEVERLSELEGLSTGRAIAIKAGFRVLRDRDRFVIVRDTDSRVHQRLNLASLAGERMLLAGLEFRIGMYDPSRKGEVLQLDAGRLPEEVILRTWGQGDRIRPLGMEGSQSVADLLTNRKVSAAQKKSTLVLVSFDANVHAVIFPHPLMSGEMGAIAEHARCHTKGQPVLVIQKPDHHP
jgi:tRNA(Ile)-lysidine synthase